MADTTFSSVGNMSTTTVSGIMTFMAFQNKLNLKSAKAMNIKTEDDGLTITSLDFSTWNSTGLVTENFSASHTNNTTGTLDLNVSVEIDADSALINLN